MIFFFFSFFLYQENKKALFCQSNVLHSVSSERYIYFLKAKNKSSGKGESMFDKGVCSHSDIPGLNFIYLLNPFSDNGTACFLSSVSIQLIPPIIFMYTPGEPHFEVHSITTPRDFFLRVRGPLSATPQNFRNLLSCWKKSDTSQFFKLKLSVFYPIVRKNL